MFSIHCISPYLFRHPEAAPINAIRQDLDRKSHKLKDVLLASEMRNQYFNGCKPDEKAVVKAFAAMNQESALKTKPKASRMPSLFHFRWSSKLSKSLRLGLIEDIL